MKRRFFLYSIGALGLSSLSFKTSTANNDLKKIGIIGLDTSHSLAFAKELFEDKLGDYKGYKVVAAFPLGNPNIATNGQRISKFTKEIQEYNVKIVPSLQELLTDVDYVLLETNDGNMHLEQARIVIESGKPLFIDKPIANSWKDANEIFRLAACNNVPVFSTSSLRYIEGINQIYKDKVIGADVYSPAPIEPSHKDLYWYGIHGVEMLFSILGEECCSVQVNTEGDCDIVTGIWNNKKTGILRAFTKGDYGFGGTVFIEENGIIKLGDFRGYKPLLLQIIHFFETKKSPIPSSETLAICKFIDAAHKSKRSNGEKIYLDAI